MHKDRCELYQVMRIVGEKEVQVVERTACSVSEYAQPVIKIIDVMVDITGTIDLVFPNKVVKEGVFQVGVLFAGYDELVRYVSIEVPFMAEIVIPGVQPGMDVQNKLLRVDQVTEIVTKRPDNEIECQVFDIRMVAHFLVRVTENVERKLAKCRPRNRCSGSAGYSTIRGNTFWC